MGGRRFALLCSVGLVLGGLTACSVLLDTKKEQCATDADCVARGGPFATTRCVASVCVAGSAGDAAGPVTPDGGPLGCVGIAAAPKPTAARATVRLRLHDFIVESQPVTQVTVRVCPNSGDPKCTDVRGSAQPDITGTVTFDLDLTSGPFAGYFAVDPIHSDAGAGDGGGGNDYMPSRLFYSSITIASDINDDWVLPTATTLASFTSLYKLEAADPSLGTIFLYAQDCNGKPVAGLHVSVDQTGPSSRQFYFVDNTPVVTATSTDVSGYVGFLNLPTGARVLTGEMADSKERLGSITLFSFPGALTFAALGPELRR